MSENNEKRFSTALARVSESFFPLIERQLQGNGVLMDGYSKQCVITAISAINAVLDNKLIAWNDPQLDKNNITQILTSIACLKLNAAASPREVYFQLRNVKVTGKDENGQKVEVWKKQIEMGIEGDGNDAILANFGRDVKKVCQFWLVREGDAFEYPRFNGLEMDPPKWTPTGKGDVVRVVYPVVKTDGIVEFYIGERDDVAKNLLAHINNNLMNETFGICKNRYDATDAQKKQIAVKKNEVLKKAKDLGLDALDDPELQEWISPAWTEYQSREQMIIRKMRNNIVKKIPKDFGNAYIEMTYAEESDEALARTNQEVRDNANRDFIDIEGKVVDNSTPPADVDSEDKTENEPSDPEPPATDNPADKNSDLPPTGTDGPGF